MRRLIQKEVENALARQVLGGGFVVGSRVVVDVADDRLTFVTEPPSELPVTEEVVNQAV